MLDKKLLKRFVKTYKLPIQVFEEPYFSYLIDLYDLQFNTKEKLIQFEKDVASYENPESYLSEAYKIKDKFIEDIKSNPAYQEFIEGDLSKYDIDNRQLPSKNKLYSKRNIGKTFVSVDLNKANFQALKFIGIIKENTYEELISKYTDLISLKESKHLRQVLFGNLNNKRTNKVEKYIINNVLSSLLEKGLLLEKIIYFGNDEIVYEVDDLQDKALVPEHAPWYKTEIFKLNDVGEFYVKEFIDGTYKFQCVPDYYYAQVFKRYNNLSLAENDLVFTHEKQLCRFINPIEVGENEEI